MGQSLSKWYDLRYGLYRCYFLIYTLFIQQTIRYQQFQSDLCPQAGTNIMLFFIQHDAKDYSPSPEKRKKTHSVYKNNII